MAIKKCILTIFDIAFDQHKNVNFFVFITRSYV